MNRYLPAARVSEEVGSRHRLRLGWTTRAGECGLVRASTVAGLFDQVWMHTSGRRHEAVTAYAGTSVVWGRGTKGLVELALLRPPATVDGRGYALVTSEQDAVKWLNALGDSVGEALAAVRDRKGPGLLTRTAEARHRAALYDALLPPETRDANSVRQWIEERVAADQRIRALQLSDTPGMAMTREDAGFVELAALLIAGPGSAMPPTDDLLRARPLASWHLAASVTILADLIRQRCVAGIVYTREAFLVRDNQRPLRGSVE